MRMFADDACLDVRQLTFTIWDDFAEFVTGDVWTSVLTDSGTIAVEDMAGGILLFTASDGTVADNDEVYLKSTKEVLLFANDKPIYYGARLKFTEANVDDANVCHGMMDAVAANAILDDGGGPKASYSGAVFFKVDGGTVWWFETSIAGVQTTTQVSDVANAGDGTYRWFEIEVRPINSTLMEVIPKIDGKQCLDTNYQPIKHRVTYTGATEMNVFAGLKNGGANLETMRADWIAARQLR